MSSNWMVTSVSRWYNKEINKEEKTERLVGIYPTYREAAFIKNKIGTRNKLITIESTAKEPTSTKVNEYLKKMEQRSQKWEYIKHQNTMNLD